MFRQGPRRGNARAFPDEAPEGRLRPEGHAGPRSGNADIPLGGHHLFRQGPGNGALFVGDAARRDSNPAGAEKSVKRGSERSWYVKWGTRCSRQ